MTLLDRISEDLTVAMKARDVVRLSTLRMVKSALKNSEIEKMAPLDEAESIKVLQSQLKKRRDSIEQFEKAGRTDLAQKEAAEMTIIDAYLPAPLDERALTEIVDQALVEIGATSAKDMGRAMKAVMSKLADQAVDGKVVSGLVKSRLGS